MYCADEMEHGAAQPPSRPLVAVADDAEEAGRSSSSSSSSSDNDNDEIESMSDHSADEQPQPQPPVTMDVTSDKSHG